ncbi:MAG: hypothetical protein JO208_14235 [Alphaproteobacteria bacterium]|nr:hypothetical protein [Alphaproteobacteria bacterium]
MHVFRTTALVFAILGAVNANAQTRVYNNFHAHHSSNSHSAICVKGAASAQCGEHPSSLFMATAVAFSPSASGLLSYIDVAAGQYSGTQGVAVTLVKDNAGAPSLTDPILEGWVLTSKEIACCEVYLHEKLSSVAAPSLTAGTTYWIVMTPVGFDSFTYWQRSYDDQQTKHALSYDGGVTWQNDLSIAQVFDVYIQ